MWPAPMKPIVLMFSMPDPTPARPRRFRGHPGGRSLRTPLWSRLAPSRRAPREKSNLHERHQQKEVPGRGRGRCGGGGRWPASAGVTAERPAAVDRAQATRAPPRSRSWRYVAGPAGSGVLRLMVGEREVVVHDRDLVTRILNAAGGE